MKRTPTSPSRPHFRLSTALTILLARFVTFVLKLTHNNAGNVPGRVALKISPHIRDHLQVSGQIIVITGTNGKTTTTNMLAAVLRATHHQVIVNSGGNNIDWGITTTLLQNADFRGRITCDYLLLETDEHWVPVLYAQTNLTIHTLIILDFFRDQLDRAGEMETIIAKLENFVSHHPCQLILNGDDPNIVRIGRANPKGQNFYYGLAKLDSSYRTSHDKMEGIICPYCKTPLRYSYYQYSHLGHFKCPKCDYRNPPPDTKATKISGHNFWVDRTQFSAQNPNLYNIYNMLAIIQFAKTASLPTHNVQQVLARYENTNGRYQAFDIRGRHVILNLCKNPTGFNVIFRPLKHLKHSKRGDPGGELLLVLNDHVNDGHDVSWIWDIDFTEMDGFARIICAGTRAYDMAIPIKINGYDPSRIVVEHDISRAIHQLLTTPGQKYIITNYSPLAEVRHILTKLQEAA